MFEKVNPSHPDKLADRIAGAIVDLAYSIEDNPKVAVEVLIGHDTCHVIAESSVGFDKWEIVNIIHRISGKNVVSDIVVVPQDEHLANNQSVGLRCGDNGIFKGMPVRQEERMLTEIAKDIFAKYPTDGKYVIKGDRLVICQSCAETEELQEMYPTAVINPIGSWTGGIDVDSGATNRKLGSDMGDSVSGGGLHGKDLSKADVSVNIYAFLKAQMTGRPVEIACAIGDRAVDGRPYSDIVHIAKTYIDLIGGFEKFAEWGLIR